MSRYLDTINSETGELNTISALNLIVFGAKLEHLDLIEYVVVDLLKVKWSSFIRREFFKQMFIFLIFFLLGMFCFIVRPVPQGICKLDLGNSTDFENGTTTTTTTTTSTTTSTTMMTEIISELVTGLPMLANETNQTSSEDALVTFCSEDEGNLVVETGLGVCYLHVMDTPIDKIRMVGEGVLVVMGIYFILKVNSSHTISFIQSSINQKNCFWQAVHEFTFLGWRVFMQNMVLCPSRVAFLISCVLVQVNQDIFLIFGFCLKTL